MSALVFEAPDAGLWEQDGVHFPRPLTRFFQETFRDGFMRGFKGGTSRYGLMLDHLQPAFVNGFLYMKQVNVGVPPEALSHPPKEEFLQLCKEHPELARRLKTAATVLEEKPWRDDIRNWDEVLKPKSRENHLRLQAQDPAAMSDVALADYLNDCLENSRAMHFQHHVYTISCGMPVGDFMASAQEWTGLSAGEIAQALRGSTPISAGVSDEYLAALQAIAGDAQARRLLNGPGRPGTILRELQALPGKTGEAIKTYLDLVSNRIVGGYDISCRTAIETPELLVKALQARDSPDDLAQAAQRVSEQTAKIRAAVPQAQRTAFDELLAEARLINRLRDERGYWSDLWATGIARRAYLEVGRRLAATGRIEAAEHALDASSGEAIAMLTGSGSALAPSAAELAARHHFRVTVANDVAPPFLNGTPSPPLPLDWFPERARRTMRAMGAFMAHVFGATDKVSEAKIVRGIAVSAGQYEGRARVIASNDSQHLIEKGEVLVTRSTSTAFNYVLPLVGAIVTDRGGLMSHAAIVAREYGLPGVVGCEVATSTIPNGAMVRVDADKGEVTILS